MAIEHLTPRHPKHGSSLRAFQSHTDFTPGPWHEHSHRQIGPDEGIVAEVWSALVVVAGCNGDGLFDDRERTIRAALAKVEGGAA